VTVGATDRVARGAGGFGSAGAPPVRRWLTSLLARRPDLAPAASRIAVLAVEGDGRAPQVPREAERLLVVGWLGTHRDARDARLRAGWDLEERARASGRPTLALRLSLVLGAGEPMWARLASSPRLGRRSHRPLQPVLVEDVVATLERALEGHAAWEGWFELCGEEVLTLGELIALASRTPAGGAATAAWEPPLEIVDEMPLAESAAWRERFAITPGSVTAWAGNRA
jgi:uncharacterized protein YbjT (DUF2867 family)